MLSLGRELDVLRIVLVTTNHDDVFGAAGDEQLAVDHRAEVAGAQERSRAVGEARAKNPGAVDLAAPIAARDARRCHPDLADLAVDAWRCRSRIDDQHPRAVAVRPARDERLAWRVGAGRDGTSASELLGVDLAHDGFVLAIARRD